MRRFRRLCEQHQNRIFTFTRYYLGNREDAEDVTQEVLLRLWEHGRQVPEPELPAWLTRVARNACVDVLRKRRTYPAAVGSDPGALVGAAARGPGPDSLAEASQFGQHLERALQLLPEAQRAVLVLREVQGMKYEEISESVGLPVNTVKVYLHRGRQALRGHLQGMGHDRI
jgi:RNA polymerase sigma-70 factor (ECF subfamily)